MAKEIKAKIRLMAFIIVCITVYILNENIDMLSGKKEADKKEIDIPAKVVTEKRGLNDIKIILQAKSQSSF